MEHFHYVSVENCMWKYGQGFYHLTYVEPKHRSNEHNQAGANDFQHLIWKFWVCVSYLLCGTTLIVLNVLIWLLSTSTGLSNHGVLSSEKTPARNFTNHFFFFFFWPRHVACGTLVPWPGIEPGPLAVKVQSPDHWTTREVPYKPLLTHSISHSIFSIHCTNLFLHFRCIVTFLEIIKHSMPKMLFFFRLQY